MNGRTHTRKLSLIVAALCTAAIAIPSAFGHSTPVFNEPGSASAFDTYDFQEPTSVTVTGGASHAIPAALSRIQEPGSVSDFDTYDFQEPTGAYAQAS
jgi:hypothetical protein